METGPEKAQGGVLTVTTLNFEEPVLLQMSAFDFFLPYLPCVHFFADYFLFLFLDVLNISYFLLLLQISYLLCFQPDLNLSGRREEKENECCQPSASAMVSLPR